MACDKDGIPVIQRPEREAALQEAIKVVDDYSTELALQAGHETNSWSDPVQAALLEARNRINAKTEWCQDVTESLQKEQQ